MSLDAERAAYIEALRGIPAERRQDAVGAHCFADATVLAAEGAIAGLALSLLVRRPYLRGAMAGLGVGGGLGFAGRKCFEKNSWARAATNQSEGGQ